MTNERGLPPGLPVGVLLAGGRGQRMGGTDKPLLPLAGRPLLSYVAAALAPHCRALVVNANGDPARLARFGLPVVADPFADYPGPLAGILAGMNWAAAHYPACTDILSAAGDTPFLPPDLLPRLRAARKDAPIVCARSAGRAHPTIALWRVALAPRLALALTRGERAVLAWAASEGLAFADFPTEAGDPFFNVNTPADLAAAGRRLAPQNDRGMPSTCWPT